VSNTAEMNKKQKEEIIVQGKEDSQFLLEF
jgi:hypothetical protein